jgi:hypothetical protein
MDRAARLRLAWPPPAFSSEEDESPFVGLLQVEAA